MLSLALRRILCVEDDPDIQKIVRTALVRIGGFETLICGSGNEALASVASFRPDLVILDVMMPGLDGPATMEAIRKIPAAAAVPVVFMTARAQPHEVSLLLALGAVGVITKPFDPLQLPNLLRDLWAQGISGAEPSP